MVNLTVQELEELYKTRDTISCVVDYQHVNNEVDLFCVKEHFLEKGYEGVILRDPSAPYKYGRSRPSDGALIKFKDFTDEEATVVGFKQFFHNDNEAVTDAMGHMKRSAHQANKRPAEMLGALVAQSANWPVTFEIGSGFDMALRETIWANQSAYIGRQVKFKYLKPGTKDRPRHPIFLGFRDPSDIS